MYNGIIEEKTEELHLALNREQTQLDKYRTRVRAMEETGGYNILTVLMSSGDFNEFLTALDDMEKIMTADRDLEDAYIEAREESERVKAEYEDVKADCEAKQEVLNAEKEMLDTQIAETEEELAALEDQIDHRNRVICEPVVIPGVAGVFNCKQYARDQLQKISVRLITFLTMRDL